VAGTILKVTLEVAGPLLKTPVGPLLEPTIGGFEPTFLLKAHQSHQRLPLRELWQSVLKAQLEVVVGPLLKATFLLEAH
jgi:hypothetical protein